MTLPLTRATILLVTLISVIGSLLAFDQFYIMTAGQPFNQTATAVFYVYLNSFPYLKLGYGAALSLLLAGVVLLFTVVQLILTRRSRAMSSRVDRRTPQAAQRASAAGWRAVWSGRNRYLVGAICIVVCTRDGAAARARGPRLAQDDRRGRRAAADLLPARAEPRQLQPAVGLPGRAADLSRATASGRRC